MKTITTTAVLLLVAAGTLDAGCCCLPYKVQNSPYATPIANSVGDLVTVCIEEKVTTTDNGKGKLERRSNFLAELKQFFFPFVDPSEGFTAVKGDGDGSVLEFNTASRFEGIAENKAKHSFETKITVRLIEEIRPQEFFVRGYRLVNINGKPKKIFLSGVIRQWDITAENTIKSEQLADAIVEIESEVGQKDIQPGIINRWFNKIF
jgi:flagellar L-ring protein precursor FlgH